MVTSISAGALADRLDAPVWPLLIDVRRRPVMQGAETMIASAAWRDPALIETWAASLDRNRPVIVYCVHGHEVSQDAAAHLAAAGLNAVFLEGGIEAWQAEGRPLRPAPAALPRTRWITRERPKIDRIACPWLVLRFIDPDAEFLFVPPDKVLEHAAAEAAIPFDVPGVAFSHDGEFCSFDAFIRKYRLKDPALDRLALIIRGADTARLELAPQSPGLLAVSLGLSALIPDDLAMLRAGLVIYDALFAWCRSQQKETHGWPPANLARVA